jgi:Uma2 family endonuclease
VPEPTDRYFTPDEFFAFLEGAEEKYEYNAGRIRPMAGGTGNHNMIKSDLGVYLGGYAHAETECNFYDSDQAVYIPQDEAYVFPDLTFVCEEAQYQDAGKRRLLNPALLIEVLSESTEAYDRGGKFQKYRSLDSFREYILVDSRRYSVESFFKEDDKTWRINWCSNPYGKLYVHTLDIDLPPSAIYRRIDFPKQ